jgi:hypothetical protein
MSSCYVQALNCPSIFVVFCLFYLKGTVLVKATGPILMHMLYINDSYVVFPTNTLGKKFTLLTLVPDQNLTAKYGINVAEHFVAISPKPQAKNVNITIHVRARLFFIYVYHNYITCKSTFIFFIYLYHNTLVWTIEVLQNRKHLEVDTWKISLVIRLPHCDKSREYVKSEGYITLNMTTPHWIYEVRMLCNGDNRPSADVVCLSAHWALWLCTASCQEI